MNFKACFGIRISLGLEPNSVSGFNRKCVRYFKIKYFRHQTRFFFVLYKYSLSVQSMRSELVYMKIYDFLFLTFYHAKSRKIG